MVLQVSSSPVLVRKEECSTRTNLGWRVADPLALRF